LPDEHLLIAEGPQDFYRKIAGLLTSESMRKFLVEKSQRYICEHYDQRISMQKIIMENERFM